MKRPQEGVLADVARIIKADDPGRNAEDHIAVALYEYLEGAKVPAPRTVYQRIVGVHDRRRHYR